MSNTTVNTNKAQDFLNGLIYNTAAIRSQVESRMVNGDKPQPLRKAA